MSAGEKIEPLSGLHEGKLSSIPNSKPGYSKYVDNGKEAYEIMESMLKEQIKKILDKDLHFGHLSEIQQRVNLLEHFLKFKFE